MFRGKWLLQNYSLKLVKSVGERIHMDVVSLGLVCEEMSKKLKVNYKKGRRQN